MMKNKKWLWVLWGLLFVAYACTDEEPVLSVDLQEGGSVLLGAEGSASSTLSFSASQSWTTSVSADWLKVEPSSGEAGSHTLTLEVLKPNDTGDVRTATLSLVAGESSQRIAVTQNEYIRLEKETYELPAAAGQVNINFYTTLAEGDFGIYHTGDWSSAEGSPLPATRATEEERYYVRLDVPANESNQSRTFNVYFVKEPVDIDNLAGNILATATVVQAGLQSGTSESTEGDGEVNLLQGHTDGDGIPLILMGDGFIDTEIASGYYDEVLNQAVENFFTEHPINALRGYFDIYAVTVVSPSNMFGSGETALGCRMEGGTSTLVEGDDEAVQRYARLVEGVELDDAQVVVVLNSNAYAGTNYNYWYTNGTPSNFAIAYCPVIENLASENFRRVLVHETVGHGIGKLDDEYAYEENPQMPSDEIAERQQQQEDFGWWQNVDFTDSKADVLWSDFLFDTRYDGQGLGIFEGACTYMTGAYRSTEESMMRNNIQGFNAPSRRAIYNNIIQRGEGRTPSLEEFIDFDQRTYAVPAQTRSLVPSRPFGRPQVRRLDRPLGQ